MDIKRVLVFGQKCTQFERDLKAVHHYSSVKKFNMAKGFKYHTPEVFLGSRKSRKVIDEINFVPISEITADFLQSMDLIIFTIELSVESICNLNKNIGKLVINKENRHPIMCCRMGHHQWISKTKWSFKEVYDMFDFHFPQTPYHSQQMKKTANGDPESKIYPSPMAVPDIIPTRTENPIFSQKVINLIYMGRLRQSPSKLSILKSMMIKLGPKYHLRVYCGGYNKPGSSKKLSPYNNETNLLWLKNYFLPLKNVTVNDPLIWGSHWNYLHHSDVGIDFSPNIRSTPYPAGNAKLLEYMAVGLPTVVERGPGNLYLLENAGGGIVLQNGASAKKYSNAVKKITTMNFDRDKISKFIIKRNCWSVRTKQILDIVKEKD